MPIHLQTVMVRDKQVDVAQKIYHDSRQRFECGLISVNDLSLDEARLLDHEINAINAWTDLHREVFAAARDAGVSIRGKVLSF